MKNFIKKAAIFVSIILLISISIELILLTKPNVYSYKRKFVENHLNDISVLLMGNSHIEEALIPNMIGDSVFNFAISGRSYTIDFELAERYIPMMDNLSVVLMPLDYTAFNLGRLEHKDDVEPKQRERINSTYKCMYTKYFGVKQYGFFYWSEILNSCENYMGRLAKDNNRDFCDSLGFVGMDVQKRPEDWKEQRVPGRLIPNAEINKDAYNKLMQGYEKICSLCKKRGARIVLVSTPVYKTYQDAMSEVLLSDMRDFVDSLKSKYDNVEYYNFLFSQEFNDEDFFDAGHLTLTGAEKFSMMLKDSLNLK